MLGFGNRDDLMKYMIFRTEVQTILVSFPGKRNLKMPLKQLSCQNLKIYFLDGNVYWCDERNLVYPFKVKEGTMNWMAISIRNCFLKEVSMNILRATCLQHH